jgi:DNA invertase Pin-like site-specific DNA recombinase
MCKSYVSYFRVSTERQGQSGLGLEAQQNAVDMFIRSKGEDARLLASYVEVESGKKDNRPELAKALAFAKAKKATLIIAKLDRLSRKAAFLLNLRDSGVDFEALDCPQMNTLTLGVMAVFAQFEREQISARTKTALAAAKARGVKLGGPLGTAAFGVKRGLNATTKHEPHEPRRLKRRSRLSANSRPMV